MPQKPTPAFLKKYERLAAAVRGANWPVAQERSKSLLAQRPDDPNVLYLAAVTAASGLNQPKRACRHLRHALKIAPRHEGAAVLLHDALAMQGDADGALEAAQSTIENHPFSAVSYYNLAVLDTERATPLRQRMEELAVHPSICERSRAALFTGLGRIYERQGRLDAAMTAYRTSKTFRARRYPKEHGEALLRASQARYGRGAIEARAASGLQDAKRPVFIVGLPRTGSSLIERIISAHSAAASAGERPEMSAVLRGDFAEPKQELGRPYHPECDGALDADEKALKRAARAYLSQVKFFVDRPEATVWIDKMPANFHWCGAIMQLFPDARIIMTDREPRDAALSALRVSFAIEHDYLQSFETFAHYHSLQQRYAALWREALGDRLLVVRYEELVGDVEAGARRIIEHVGLPWESACAQPQKNEGSLFSASAMQVRGPVTTRSVGGWRKFEKQFEPLTALLDGPEAPQDNASAQIREAERA